MRVFSTKRKIYQRINATPFLFILHWDGYWERVELRRFLWWKWYVGFGKFDESFNNFIKIKPNNQ